MSKRDCTRLDQWPSRATEFLQIRYCRPVTPVDLDVFSFLDILKEKFLDVRTFRAYYSYVQNMPPTEHYRTTQEWIVAGRNQYGDEFLQTLFYLLCDKQSGVLVDYVLGYNCDSIKGMIICARCFYLTAMGPSLSITWSRRNTDIKSPPHPPRHHSTQTPPS